MPDQSSELLAGLTVPAALEAALQADTDRVEMQAGQVWRVRWDDQSALVLTERVTGDTVTVVGVTMALTPPEDSQVPNLTFPGDTLTTVTAWPGTRTELPLRVFERPLETGPAARAALADLPEARTDIDIFDEGLNLEAELRDSLEAFRAVPSLPVRSEEHESIVAQLTGDPGSTLTALKSVLGLSLFDAQDLMRRNHLTAEQRSALFDAGFTGAAAAGEEAFRAEDVAELEKPTYKATILSLASSRRAPEAQVRREAAQEALAYAARTATGADPVAARIRAVLAKLR